MNKQINRVWPECGTGIGDRIFFHSPPCIICITRLHQCDSCELLSQYYVKFKKERKSVSTTLLLLIMIFRKFGWTTSSWTFTSISQASVCSSYRIEWMPWNSHTHFSTYNLQWTIHEKKKHETLHRFTKLYKNRENTISTLWKNLFK